MNKPTKHGSIGFLILTREHGTDAKWTDSGEGPFDSWESAERFADAEVGADYIIVEMMIFPTHGATGRKIDF
jgi:hypothetical protein